MCVIHVFSSDSRRLTVEGDPWAGERPRLRRGTGRGLTWIAYGLALTLVIYGAFNASTAWSAARDHFAKWAQVTPDSVEGSRSFDGHPPKVLFDKINNSWWGPGVSQSADGEWMEARFSEPTLARVGRRPPGMIAARETGGLAWDSVRISRYPSV
ncbi:hypothetical protein [Streptomyces goshikiensis]|uniref:hypothetical protein n=1 Tax=Streptomyces goshikiensis TaxID=1942 RepID=UPI0036B70B46